MIMPRGTDQLLLPVNPLFIAFTLVVAALLEMLPVGRHPASPDLLALALVVWTVHQPLRVGMGTAFCAGLVMDVHTGGLLGHHALVYTLLSYLGLTLQRRLRWFSLWGQAVQVLPLFVVVQAVSLALRMLAGGMFPGWWMMAAPVAQALLWPLASWLLLAPQRRAPDPDQNRPL